MDAALSWSIRQLQIVKKQGFCLEHLSEEFQADKEIVIAAISSSNISIEFASKALQEDEEILAILENPPWEE